MNKNYIIALLMMGNGLYAQKMNKTHFGQEITEVSKKIVPIHEVTGDAVVWEQKVSSAENKYAIVSTFYIPENWGLYSADDFQTEKDITIQSILFYGSQSNDEAQSLIRKVNLYLYTDQDGKPAGSPEIQGSEYKKITFGYSDLKVEPGEFYYMGDKIYHIDIQKVLGEGIKLPAGVYWASIVFDIDTPSSEFSNRFSWADSEALILHQPKAISKELGINDWTDIPKVGFPVKAFAFTLYGDNSILSTNSFNSEDLQLFPNPTSDYFYLTGASIKEIKSIDCVDLLGQKKDLVYENGKVNISHLNKGVYLVLIHTSQGTVTKKLIKK